MLRLKTRTESDLSPLDQPSDMSPRTSYTLQKNGSLTKEAAETRQINRQLALAYHVKHARLVGRAVELFHKSIHVRSMDLESIWRLRADVSSWWNNLPPPLQEDPESANQIADANTVDSRERNSGVVLSLFFRILHHQQIMLINRPWLSLEPTSPEFNAALQACVNASRHIITTLRREQELQRSVITWPAHLSAVWMSGLIILYACQLRAYSMDKGRKEISHCLELLKSVSDRWQMAKHCHSVLSHLRSTLDARESAPLGESPRPPREDGGEKSTTYNGRRRGSDDSHQQRKRPKLNLDAAKEYEHNSSNIYEAKPDNQRQHSLHDCRNAGGRVPSGAEDTHSALTIPMAPEDHFEYAAFAQPLYSSTTGAYHANYASDVPTDSLLGSADDLMSANWDSGLADVFGGLHALPFNWDLPASLDIGLQ